MTCIRKVNALDRLILAGRDPKEPACRLLVERLKWATIIGLLLAVAIMGYTVTMAQQHSNAARQQLAEFVKNDCVDRPGDIAFRNVLADLVALNERSSLPAREQRRRTALILRSGLREAGPVPACIASNVP